MHADSQLRVLDLSGNRADTSDRDRAGAAVAGVIRRTRLRVLAVHGLSYSLAAVWRALDLNTSLRALDVSHTKDVGWPVFSGFRLGVALSRNSTLTALNVAHCGADEDELDLMARELGRARGLRHLDLSGNPGLWAAAGLWAALDASRLRTLGVGAGVESPSAPARVRLVRAREAGVPVLYR